MAKVAVVEGVTIMLYANEHPPPHFHAKIAEFQAVIDVKSLKIIRGRLPPNKTGPVIEWATIRQNVLTEAFEAVRNRKKIEPIR